VARVVVVGGGFAGLAVAVRLARGRHRVTLVERAGELGGSLRGVDLGAGLRVHTGPTTFTMPAALRDLFRKTGKPIEDVLELEPVDPARRYVFADGATLDLPSSGRVATMRAFDHALGPPAGAEWESLLVRGRQMWEVLRRDVVEAPIGGRGQLARALASRRSLAVLRAGRSLDDLADATLSDPRARQVLATYALDKGGEPRRAPAALAVLPYLEHAFGLWRLPSGPLGLVRALAERAVLRGAELRTDAEVAEILVEGGMATGVRLRSGARLPADLVVTAMDVGAAGRLVVGAPPPPKRSRPAGTARFTIVLGPDEAPSEAGAQPTETLYLGTRTKLEARTPGTPAAQTTSTPITARRHRAGDRPLWTIDAPVPLHDPSDTDWRDAAVATTHALRLLDVLAARGLDLRSAAILAIQTPADLEDQTGARGGAVLGPPPHGLSGAFGRAANQSRTPGLYAVGASAHPGPGLAFVALSAALVSDLIGAAPRRGGGAATGP